MGEQKKMAQPRKVQVDELTAQDASVISHIEASVPALLFQVPW